MEQQCELKVNQNLSYSRTFKLIFMLNAYVLNPCNRKTWTTGVHGLMCCVFVFDVSMNVDFLFIDVNFFLFEFLLRLGLLKTLKY